MPWTGRCACGQLSYQAEGDPLIVHCCHCTYCQRETGTAFATNVLIESDRVAISGDIETIVNPSASGQGQRIIRCPACHVAVSSHYPGAGDAFHFLRAGTLDQRADVEPDVHIYTSTKVPWVIIPDDVPAFPEFYDPASVWTEQMRERWRVAKGL
jgi:hypothetical protein